MAYHSLGQGQGQGQGQPNQYGYPGGYNNGPGNYGYQHSNTFNPPPNNFQRANTYQQPYPPMYPPQQPPYQQTNTFMPPPSNYHPMGPPPQNNYPPQQPPNYQRANTFMPPQQQPYQQPMYPPPQGPNYQHANTYMPQQPMGPGFAGGFSAEADCKILRDAMHGLGTDEQAIINICCSRNVQQRAEIRRVYKACYGKDLIDRLKSDLSGNFKDCVCGLFMTPPEYDAYCLYNAMKGIGTKEGVLIEIIATRNNIEIQQMKDAFRNMYNDSLEKWVSGDTSGNFKRLLIALLQANRSNNMSPNMTQCQTDAQALYQAGEGRWGTDEATFIRIFAQRSPAELAMIDQCYTQLRGKGLLKAIDSEFSGDIKRLLNTIVNYLKDPAGYFASRIRESVKGIGTCDSKLVRVIVSRCEVDLGNIVQAYRRIYGRDMLADVRDDTSGNYKKILTALISRVSM